MATKKTEKQVYIALKEDTRRLIRMLGAQKQFASGMSTSDNEAVYDLFKTYRPDLIEELEAQKKRERELEKESRS